MDDNTNSLSALVELDRKSGKLQESETFQGYTEFVPAEEERVRMERYIQNELTQAITDYAPIWAEAKENTDTYKAKKLTIDGGEDVLPSPLARIAADQIISWAYNTILRPRPLLSIDPYFPQTYSVMFPVDMPDPNNPQGPPQQVPTMVPRDAEKIALTWELGYEYILRERVKFPKKLLTVLTDIVTSAAPCWVKVCYNHETRAVMQAQTSGNFVDLSDKRETQIAVGDPVQWVVLPVYNVIRPLDAHDIQSSPWMAEWTPTSENDFMAAWYNGEYPLITDKNEAIKLSKMMSQPPSDAKAQSDNSQQKATPSAPRAMCQLFDVLMYWDVRMPIEGSRKKVNKRLSLLTKWHHGAGKLLGAWRNPYDHQMRWYVPFFQMEDPHTLSGTGTVGILKWHQRVKTQCLALDIMNASSANNMCTFADPDTEAFAFLSKAPKLRVNELIPKREDEYVENWRRGEGHQSLLPIVAYVDADAMRAANMSSVELGENIPGRTPSSTVSQVLQQGQQQLIMMLRNVCERLAECVKLDLRTRKQFYPMGETFHVQDPETQQLLEILFNFPVEDAVENFRFAFTAADEEVAKEHELPQLMALKQLVDQNAQFVAQIAGPMSNPAASPAQVNLWMKMLESNQAVVDRIISLSRTDVTKFDYTAAIEGIKAEREQMMAQAQAAAAQPKEPPPPQVKISLSGKLTPEQEAAAAQQVGLGGSANEPGNPNAQAGGVQQSPGGGNGNGSAGPPSEPGLPGMGAAGPPGGVPPETVQ